jgi:hypothetical protein
VGTPIPNVVAGSARFGVTPSTDPIYHGAVAGTLLDYLVRAPRAGQYALTLDSAAASGATVNVYVDNVLKGTLTLSATGSTTTFASSTPLPLDLGEGLAVVRLEVTNGSLDLLGLTFAAGGTVTPPTGNQPPRIVTAPSAVNASEPWQRTWSPTGRSAAWAR